MKGCSILPRISFSDRICSTCFSRMISFFFSVFRARNLPVFLCFTIRTRPNVPVPAPSPRQPPGNPARRIRAAGEGLAARTGGSAPAPSAAPPQPHAPDHTAPLPAPRAPPPSPWGDPQGESPGGWGAGGARPSPRCCGGRRRGRRGDAGCGARWGERGGGGGNGGGAAAGR